jgi:serine protease Do
MDNIEDIKMTDQGPTSQKPPVSRSKQSRPGLGWRLVAWLVVVALFFGGLGGAGTVIILSANGQDWLKKLGVKEDITIPTTETKKIKIEESSVITKAVEKIKPAVVSIVAKGRVRDLSGQVQTAKVSGGSGFIITADGLIITNKHVVSDQSLDYQVYLNDGSKYEATVKSRDPFNDLAVIKIKATNLPVVELGSSEDMAVGQYVIAIGYALGQFQNTVTLGVLSAKERNLQAQGIYGQTENLEGLLQVDAAINEGNSGGPLVNSDGQVVGVNVAKAEEGESIGFAIPVEVVDSTIESLNKYGKIVRPYLGVRYITITPNLANLNKLSVNYGAIIYSDNPNQSAVISDSPADRAGLKQKDIITKINDKKIDSTHSLSRLLQQYWPGDKVTVTYLRQKEEQQAKITLDRHDRY